MEVTDVDINVVNPTNFNSLFGDQKMDTICDHWDTVTTENESQNWGSFGSNW